MEYVSLLPPEIKAGKIAQRKQKKLILAFIMLLVLLLAVSAFLLASTFMTHQRLRSIQAERESVDREVAALQEYENLYRQMISKDNIIRDAMGTAPAWGELLRDIGQALPVGTWLSDLNLNYADDGGALTIRGWAYDHRGVAETLDRLFEIEQLDQIEVGVATETDYEGLDVVQFQAVGAVLPGPEFFSDNQGGE